MFAQLKHEKLFELQVSDVFNFEDGRTLFSGKLKEQVTSLTACEAELQIDEKVFTILAIEGNWMPGKKGLSNPLFRTVSTTENVNKAELPYKEGRVRLIGYKK